MIKWNKYIPTCMILATNSDEVHEGVSQSIRELTSQWQRDTIFSNFGELGSFPFTGTPKFGNHITAASRVITNYHILATARNWVIRDGTVAG